MSLLTNRTTIFPVWLVVVGLFALYASPMTLATGGFLLVIGVVAPAVLLIFWQERSPTVAEVLHQAEASNRVRAIPPPESSHE